MKFSVLPVVLSCVWYITFNPTDNSVLPYVQSKFQITTQSANTGALESKKPYEATMDKIVLHAFSGE